MSKHLSIIFSIALIFCCSFHAKAINTAPSFAQDTFYLSVCENSAATAINMQLTVADADAGQTETWSALVSAAHGTAVVAYTTTSTGSSLVPAGLTYMPNTGYSGNDTFIVVVSDGVDNDTTMICVTVNPLP
ncbi:MAG: surface protein, partial [Flavipsychrobacter sp.]|nr:surface protein [Flavipsychrobacter sp.]